MLRKNFFSMVDIIQCTSFFRIVDALVITLVIVETVQSQPVQRLPKKRLATNFSKRDKLVSDFPDCSLCQIEILHSVCQWMHRKYSFSKRTPIQQWWFRFSCTFSRSNRSSGCQCRHSKERWSLVFLIAHYVKLKFFIQIAIKFSENRTLKG